MGRTSVAEAIANAMIDLGVEVVTNVPGFGASETFMSFNQLTMKNRHISFNEEVAYTISHGAAIVGKRSACLIKAHGLAKAANSVTDSLYTTTTAGFVTMIFEDKKGSHSDNILEIVPMLEAIGFPYRRAESATIYSDVISVYEEAEKRNRPFVLLIDSSEINNLVEYDRLANMKKIFNYSLDVSAHVVHPLLADYQYKVFTACKHDMEVNFQKPVLPVIPKDLPKHVAPSVLKYKSFFDIFQNFRGDIVAGDTSASSYYSFPPFQTIDMITYIGSSIPLAIGAYLAGNRHVWALSGDFGFLAAGHMGLLEAAARDLPIKIVVFYNKKAAATGGQPLHKKSMLRILSGYNQYIRHIADPNNPLEINEVLEEASTAGELRIILVDY